VKKREGREGEGLTVYQKRLISPRASLYEIAAASWLRETARSPVSLACSLACSGSTRCAGAVAVSPNLLSRVVCHS